MNQPKTHTKSLHEARNEPKGSFTDAEIEAANAQHDQRYGFDPRWPTLLQNVQRRPECVFGPLPWQDKKGV